MTAPTELSLESVRNFMLANGGKVTNHDIVKHFKHFLTNPETRVEDRNHFKEIVNALATIRTEDGEKYIVLKRKYQPGEEDYSLPRSPAYPTSPTYVTSPINNVGLPTVMHDYSPVQNEYYANNNYSSPASYHSRDLDSPIRLSPARQPPPYRAPPPPVSNSPRPSPPMMQAQVRSPRPPPITALLSEQEADAELARDPLVDSADGTEETFSTDSKAAAPPVPPRRRSSVKLTKADKENIDENLNPVKKCPKNFSEDNNAKPDQAEVEPEQKISVRDAMQKFNRLASENELSRVQEPNVLGRRKTQDHKKSPSDDDDTVSVTLLDAKSREWLVRAAQCDYQRLARMSAENPRLACFKDPTNGYTALHWAAKHGNEDVVKLIAGAHHANVNIRSNGGYSALHIAMMFGHEAIYNLLVQVYGADQNMRDWSGRKPRQYQASQDTSVSADTFRKIKARKKNSEKDLGFLRIGSLNVRVKRTTEAFSNFLGVGQPNSDKIHKSWGSADNLPQRADRRMMPAPSFAPIKKRKSKRAQDFSSSHSVAGNPLQDRSSAPPATSDADRDRDSDSDGAAGFDSNWHSSAL